MSEDTNSVTLTRPQKRALAGLLRLKSSSRAAGFSRWEIGAAIGKGCESFPMKTMRTLWKHNLVAPVTLAAIELIDIGDCTCGCDRWNLTTLGIELAKTIKVHVGTSTERMEIIDYLPPDEQAELRRIARDKIREMWRKYYGDRPFPPDLEEDNQ